jgi:LCP family protein required for cell wall assembly
MPLLVYAEVYMSKYDIYDDYEDNDGARSSDTSGRRRRNASNGNYRSEQGQAPRQRKIKKRTSPVAKFFKIVLCVVGVYVVALGVCAATGLIDLSSGETPLDALTNAISGDVPERTNFVIMCTDENGTRTDTIMVGCYNSATNGMDIISIPRDTVVSVSAANYEKMQEEYPEPSSNEMQINHIHHFAGNEDGPEMLVDEIERLLDIDIDYYVRVDFKAFHYFVDSIGGVEFDVPRDMDYDDPAQDLAIHLKAGTQTLDGDKAEQLVRWRHDNDGDGYAQGDIGRIETQQAFLKVLIKKAASVNTITASPKAYVTTVFKYVTTNASVSDAIKYASRLKELDMNRLNMYTLPGEAPKNRYYYNAEETEQLVYSIFKRPSSEILADSTTDSSETVETKDSKDCSIMVLNGGYTDGKAGEVRDKLNDNGYNVEEVGDYNDTRETYTRIYVNEDGLGEDLVEYFNDAKVEKDSGITGDYDIVIVIGTDE